MSQIFLRQSTASQEVPLGRFVDSTDGNTEETALSIANTDIKIWKTGATSLANKNSGGATHIANGEYYCVLDATDTDTIGPLKITIHVAGALYVQVFCTVLDEAMYDWLFGTAAPLAPTTAGRTLDVSAGGEAGIDWANVGSPTTVLSLTNTRILGLTGTIGEFDDFVDAAGKLLLQGTQTFSNTGTWTGNIVGTLSTLTTYTGNTPQTGDAFARLGAPAGASVSADVAAVKVDTAAILVDTGTTLDARIPAALVGGKMDSNVGSKTVGLALTAQEKADVNAEVLDVLNVDTFAEPGQEAPAATNTLVKKIGYLFKAWRNKKDSDGTTEKLYNDDAATVDQKRTLGESGGTVTKGEVATGP